MSEKTRDAIDLSRPAPRAVPGYQAIVDFLRREIALGRIRPGDKLPAERQLAEQLGVARETLRQALRILADSGHVVVHRGAMGGAVVQESIMDPLVIRRDVEARADSILELAEFRSIIESATASMAALRRNDDDLTSLERAQHDLNAAQTKQESRIADTEFHLAIAEASGNRMLAHAVEDARVQMFAPVDLIGFEFIKSSSLDAHEAILRAIRARDPETAAAAMREHLSMTRHEFERLLAGLI